MRRPPSPNASPNASARAPSNPMKRVFRNVLAMPIWFTATMTPKPQTAMVVTSHTRSSSAPVPVVCRLEPKPATSPVLDSQGTGPSHAKTNLLRLVPVPFTHDVRVTAGKVVFVVKAVMGGPRLLVSEHLTMATFCRGPGRARTFATGNAIRTASNGSKVSRIGSPPRVSGFMPRQSADPVRAFPGGPHEPPLASSRSTVVGWLFECECLDAQGAGRLLLLKECNDNPHTPCQ